MKVALTFACALALCSSALGGEETAFVGAPARLGGLRASRSPSRTMQMALDPSFAGGLVGNDIDAPNFDPLGLSKTADDETLKWYRAAELKHGRVAMLAALGFLVQNIYQLPDSPFQEANPINAVYKLWSERPLAIMQILTAIAAIEVLGNQVQLQTEDGGDLKWDPLGIKPNDPEEFRKMQLRELKNGRLAMISVLGMTAQEALTDQGPIDQILTGNVNPF